MTTLYYHHADFLKHDTGPGHPEAPARLTAIDQALSAAAFAALRRIEAEIPPDVEDKLALIHNRAMINRVLTGIPEHGLTHFDADTVASPGSKSAALRAVGAVCDAVDQILAGRADNAFCAVRPPGHHAMPNYPMGFCLFNNIAVAAEYARTRYGLERIAIVDFDVHHGNGTQAAFYQQAQILYASSHQWPHYPGSGHPLESGVGNIFNVPLPAGSDGVAFRAKYEETILPALSKFKPQLLLISAGFDAHKDDPLASLRLVEDDYRWVTLRLMEIADRFCGGRVVSTLEGGYHLPALAASVAVHVGCLAGVKEKVEA